MSSASPSIDQPRWRLSTRELALIFVFWTFLAVLSSVNRILDPRGFGFRMSPTAPIVIAFVEAWVWAAFTPVIFWLSSRFSAERSNWLLRAALLAVVGVGISVIVWFVLAATRDQLFEVARRRAAFNPFRDIARFRFVHQLLFYFGILAAGFAREYFLRDRQQKVRATQLQAQLAEARLDALRMQINPHFLFNTLHAISALVERDPAGVRKMIARLSELLRHTTGSRGADEIPLREELQFLGRYIEIMEIRFQGRLRVEIEAGPPVLEALVPNLILQPIVENALEHGASRAASGEVKISARRDGDQLVLSVRDHGPGVSAERIGIGLSNTRARLAELYGTGAALTLRSDPAGGALAEISLPYHVRNHDGDE